MKMNQVSSVWDEGNAKSINDNFEVIQDREAKIVSEILSKNEDSNKPQINGVKRPGGSDFRYLNDCGINFTANTNGALYRTWIYAGGTAEMGIGLALHPNPNQMAGEELFYKVYSLRHGWNHVELNFPVEKGKRYTLFKRKVTKEITTLATVMHGWSTHPDIMNNGLKFHCGAALIGGSITNYNAFFEIELITTFAQLFSLRDEKLYVGSTPPPEARYWFKPLEG